MEHHVPVRSQVYRACERCRYVVPDPFILSGDSKRPILYGPKQLHALNTIITHAVLLRLLLVYPVALSGTPLRRSLLILLSGVSYCGIYREMVEGRVRYLVAQ